MFYAKHYDGINSEKYENDPIMLETKNPEEKDKEEEEMWTPKPTHTNPMKRKSYLKKREKPLQFCSSTKVQKASKSKGVDNNIKRHRIKNKSNVNGLHVKHGTFSNDEKEDSIVSSDSDNFSIYLSESDSQSETINLKEFKDD